MQEKENLKIVKPNFGKFTKSVNDVIKDVKKEKFKDVLVLGYNQNDDMIILGGGMKRSDALWLLEWAKEQIRR